MSKVKPCRGGIVNIYKPSGLSSRMLTDQVKRLAGNLKIGHVGTLDPFADGVLPIALGSATKMIRYMDDYRKTYRVLVHFGEATDTQDLSGQVVQSLASSDRDSTKKSDLTQNDSFPPDFPQDFHRDFSGNFSPEKVELSNAAAGLSLEALTSLEDVFADEARKLQEFAHELSGKLTQSTPKYSASKKAGKPLYWYTRQGIELETKQRDVFVYSVKLLDFEINREVVSGSNLPMHNEKHAAEPIEKQAATTCEETYEPTYEEIYREKFRSFCPEEIAAIEKYFPGLVRIDRGLDNIKDIALPLSWAVFDLEVSAGTYVRAWVEDLGKLTNLCAYTFLLRRLNSGPYTMAEAISVDDLEKQLEASPEPADFWDYEKNNLLLSPASAREDFPVLNLSKKDAVKLLQGQKLSYQRLISAGAANLDDRYFYAYYAEHFLGVVKVISRDGHKAIQAERMFTELEQFNARFNKDEN